MHPTCSVAGCGELASDVDHVMTIALQPGLRLDPANLRSFCHSHHSQRTAREQSFGRAAQPERGSRHPSWLRPAVVPLVVVCGPPAAGKSQHIAERTAADHLVLDIADITARVSGFPIYAAPSSWSDAALRWRNSRLALLSYVHRWPCAWVVVSEPRAHWRRWWREHVGASTVVVLETDEATCIERIESDDRRSPAARSIHVEAVRRWWSIYERDDVDIVHRVGERPTTGAGAARKWPR